MLLFHSMSLTHFFPKRLEMSLECTEVWWHAKKAVVILGARANRRSLLNKVPSTVKPQVINWKWSALAWVQRSMNKVRVDVKSLHGERLELLHNFNQKKTGQGKSLFSDAPRVRQKQHSSSFLHWGCIEGWLGVEGWLGSPSGGYYLGWRVGFCSSLMSLGMS